MCPAFGAIRNLLRMEDAMPIVISSGDGCMYGHTFVAHFYVANRPIFSPGVSSQMWAKGSVFDELKAMAIEMAEKYQPSIIPICSLCVSDTVGLAVRTVAETSRQHRDRLRAASGVLRAHARQSEGHRRRFARVALCRRSARRARASTSSAKCFRRIRSRSTKYLRRMGTHVNTHVPGPRWADYVAMVDGSLNAPLHPFYSESVKRMKMKQGLPFVEGAPVGIDGTYAWIVARRYESLGLDASRVRGGRDRRTRPRGHRDGGLSTLSGLTFMVAGYEGHEFLLVRLIDRGRCEGAVSLDLRQYESARARRRGVVARARLHGALRRQFRRRDRRVARSRLRLRLRHDAALRACERTRYPVDLLHERDGDAVAHVRGRRERHSLARDGDLPEQRALPQNRELLLTDGRAATHADLVGADDRPHVAPARARGRRPAPDARRGRRSGWVSKQELASDVVNTPIRSRVTDLDHAGGDTGAMQVFASLRDGNVVLDGPGRVSRHAGRRGHQLYR